MNTSLSSQRELENSHDVEVIRPYQSGDWPALWQLRACQLAESGIVVDADDIVPSCPDLNSAYERDFHRLDRVYLSGRGNFWIAWKNDHPVGHIGAQDMGEYIELRRMYVRETHRRAGIGTQLVTVLIDHCRQHKVRFIQLWTDPDAPGRKLYEQFCFQEVENSSGKQGLVNDARGEIRMARDLSFCIIRS